MADLGSAGMGEARFTLDIQLPIEEAWRRLVNDIDRWWPAAYRACGPSSHLRLDAVPGGTLLEVAANQANPGNGVLWYTVQAVDAPASLVLAGFVAPPFGGPALSLLRLALVSHSAKRSRLEIHDSLVGRIDVAAVQAGWREIFEGYASL